MTELEKAARIALEALRHGVSQLNGIGIPMEADPLHTAIAALTQALATTERKGEPFPGYVNLAGTLRRIQRSTYLSRDDQIALSHAADTLAALPLPTERKGEPEVMQDGGPPCKRDPRAPHGFLRNASHSAGRYVCECEFWEPPATPEPVQTERDQSRKGGSDNE